MRCGSESAADTCSSSCVMRYTLLADYCPSSEGISSLSMLLFSSPFHVVGMSCSACAKPDAAARAASKWPQRKGDSRQGDRRGLRESRTGGRISYSSCALSTGQERPQLSSVAALYEREPPPECRQIVH